MEDTKTIEELGQQLIFREDGLLENKYTGLLYHRISDTEVIPLKSPQNGAFLIPNSDGTFHTDYDSTTYLLGKNGNIIPQIDPYSRGELVNVDGKLISKYTGAEFSYDSSREVYIPHYIPDDSLEPAHIEGDYLVGNTTGRKFVIDSDGTILTPREEYIREQQRQFAENLKQIEADGEIDNWMDNATKRVTEKVTKTPLELYIENIKSHPESATEEDFENLKILMETGKLPDETMDKINKRFQEGTIVNTSLEEFLKNFHNEKELSDYLVSIGLHPNMAIKLHQIDSSFFENLMTGEKNANIAIHNNGSKVQISISTTPNNRQSIEINFYPSGNFSFVRSKHDPLLVKRLRTGSAEKFDARINTDNTLVISEKDFQLKLHSQDDLSFKGSATTQEYLILQDGTKKLADKKGAEAICYLENDKYLEPVSSKAEPANNDVAYQNFTKLISLGFQEKYFQKEKIAGLSYDLEGNETFLENEFQEEIVQNNPVL